MENEGIISITISIENTCILSDIHFLLGRSERVLRDGILRIRWERGLSRQVGMGLEHKSHNSWV